MADWILTSNILVLAFSAMEKKEGGHVQRQEGKSYYFKSTCKSVASGFTSKLHAGILNSEGKLARKSSLVIQDTL